MVVAVLLAIPFDALAFDLNPQNINLERIKFQEEKLNLPGAFGGGFLQDKEGFFWFGLQSGLAKWDGRRLFIFDTQNSNLSHIHVTGLLEDKDGYLWVATRGGGLNRYDKRSNSFTNYRHDRNNPKSIASDSLGSIFTEQILAQDQQGYIWAVSANAGISRLDPKTGEFSRFQSLPES